MKRILSILLALLIALAFPAMCFAGRNTADLPYVYDDAAILTRGEIDSLSAQIKAVIDKYDKDLAILIFDDLEGRRTDQEVMQAADDLYDYNGFGCGSDSSGTLLLLSLDPNCRMWWTTAKGSAEKYYTEDNINYIDDNIYGYMVDGKFAKAFETYIALVDELYRNGKFPINQGYTENPNPYQGGPGYNDTTAGEAAGVGAAGGGIIGLIAGLISHGTAKRSMKTVGKAHSARNYLDTNSLRLNDMRDIFLYRTESRTRIQSTSSSSSSGGHPGGRSSYSGGHRSSSGSHHTGGGRRF